MFTLPWLPVGAAIARPFFASEIEYAKHMPCAQTRGKPCFKKFSMTLNLDEDAVDATAGQSPDKNIFLEIN